PCLLSFPTRRSSDLRNRVWISLFDLWTVLGTIYMDLKDWENAKACFDVVLSLRDKFPEKEMFITTYTRIGIMHMNLKEWDQAKLDRKSTRLNSSHVK